MKVKILFILILILNILPASALTDKEKKDVIDKINKTSSGISTMSGSFTQTKNLSLLNDKMVSEGTINYQKSDKLRWEYTTPYKYIFIFNGSKVYVGNKNKKDVIDTNTNKVFKEVARIMMSTVTGTALSNSTDFTTDVSESGNQYLVTLVPKKKEMKSMFSKVILSFNKNNLLVSEINIVEKNGDKTNIKFKNITTNKKIDANLFAIPK